MTQNSPRSELRKELGTIGTLVPENFNALSDTAQRKEIHQAAANHNAGIGRKV